MRFIGVRQTRAKLYMPVRLPPRDVLFFRVGPGTLGPFTDTITASALGSRGECL